MSVSRHTLACGLLATLLHPAGWAQDDAAATLMQQGRYWQAQGNAERAAQAWERLLAVQPGQPEALYGMGMAALRGKRPDEARRYLAELQQRSPDGAFTRRLQQAIALATGDGPAALESARMLAASGETERAMAEYDRALQGRQPEGDIALEYYSHLGYTDAGLPRAIAGLERLARETPGNPGVELALAKHLIRTEDRRAQGVAMLARLAKRSDVGADAAESWRMGLVWMGTPRTAERPLFDAYLKANPDDAEIREQLRRPAASRGTAGPAPWRRDPGVARGLAALEAGDLALAEREFQERLRSQPNDPDALGGLGVVRMQQNDPAQAEQLLARAASRPGAGANWKRALNTARYWKLVDQAEAAAQGGDPAAARRLLEQAMRLDARAAAAPNALGRAYAASGDLAAAEKTFRTVLARQKNDTEALRGLVDVLAQSGRADEAMRLIDALPAAQQAEMGNLGRLRAAVAAGRARAAERRGDEAGARAALQDALASDPANPWTRYELARLYLRSGAAAEAQGLVDGLLASHPDMPDALYASALLASQRGDWDKAQAALARIAPADQTGEVAGLQRQVAVQQQAARAARLARAGRSTQALALLRELEPAAGRDPALLSAVGQAYVEAGEAGRGLALLRPLVAAANPPGPDLLLPYAGLLLKSEQDVEAAGVLRQVQGQAMDADQRQSFDDLVTLYTVRQAELLRERGDLVAAYDTLAPVLEQRPNDTLAQGALARMYAAGGDREKALGIYRKLLERQPDDATLQLGAATMAADLDDWRYAEQALNHALAIAPDDPEVLAGAARLYRARGKTGRAAELFTAAIAAEERRAAPVAAVASAAPARTDNPFAALPGQRTQSTRSAQVLGDALGQADSGDTVASAYPAVPAAAGTAAAALRPGPSAGSPTFSPFPAQASATPASSAAGQPVPAAAETPSMPAQPSGAYARTTDLPAAPGGAQPPRPALFGSADAPEQTAAADPATTDQSRTLRGELDEIMQERSPEVRAGVFVRANDGESGLSRLTAIEAPLEARLPAGDGKISLKVTPVTLDAGSVGSSTGDGIYKASRFGSGLAGSGAELLGLAGPAGKQRDSGVGLSVGYEMRGFSADIGTTPLGFERTNIVGGVKLDGLIDRDAGTWYSVEASRRAVTDSLVSFAGARDSRLNDALAAFGTPERVGESWGGVTASGLSGQIGWDGQDYGVYGYGSWHSLNGHNVKSNTRLEAGAGVYWHLLRQEDRLLTAGVNVGSIFYDNNQRFFTYGHGGYFSPQQFYSLSLPLTWAERRGRFSYKLQGSVGIQHFKEDGADYFPDDGNLQSATRAALGYLNAQGINAGNGTYGGQTDTGLGYNLAAAAEYQLSRNLFLGGTVSLDNATDYQQWAGGLYLRYSFYPMTRPMDLPVTPYRSPYSR